PFGRRAAELGFIRANRQARGDFLKPLARACAAVGHSQALLSRASASGLKLPNNSHFLRAAAQRRHSARRTGVGRHLLLAAPRTSIAMRQFSIRCWLIPEQRRDRRAI